MGLMDFHQKIKAFRPMRLLGLGGGDGSSGKVNARGPEPATGKKASWMQPISHGFHVVEDRPSRGESGADSVVVQREEVEEVEMWFFGVFDATVGDGITKFMQSHLFGRKLSQSQVRKKSKETMRKAYMNARTKTRESDKEEEALKMGSASVMVINGEKLVMANMGCYKAVVCKDGVAHQMSKRHHQTPNRHWSRRLISGLIRMPKVRILACDTSNPTSSKVSKSSEPVVATQGIDSDTEFVILASTGIWEVMQNQEAVNLIRHMEDPQEAAECLAREALTRMSRSSISCLVVRFD